ncbi:TlpA family protein disulfide reductase [Lysobacter sp. D1-1-M9]|uniref:TlpA family protein disulfide reductase n=1 Tax=Novilysobacter longmucuonensis TaxID=3098603 RepID=UPI002FC71BE4
MAMSSTAKVLLVAAVAGVFGAVIGIALNSPAPLLRTEIGQRVLQGVLAAGAPEPPADLAVARRGQALPALSLPRLGGGDLTLPDDYAGRPILVNLWASWCGPCIQEMPELERFAASQGEAGTQVVGIALDEEAAVREFLGRVPVSYPIVLDQAGPADAGVRLGNPRGVLPYTVLVGTDGRLLKQKIGPFEHGEIDQWADAR